MESPFYYYFQIRSDKNLLNAIETIKLRNFLNTLGEITEVADFNYKNNPPFPWLDIQLLYVDNLEAYQATNENKFEINLLIILASKKIEKDYKQYIYLLTKIAKYLHWQLIEELDGDEETIIQIPEF